MKKILLILLLLVSVQILLAPTLTWYTYYDRKEKCTIIYEEIVYNRQVDLYACHLGYIESLMNWQAVNKQGYMGIWQHGQSLLKDLGLDIHPDRFRNDKSIFPAELQYRVLKAQITVTKIRLAQYEPWIGTTIKDTYITRAGLLAGCHLGGLGAVRSFLYSNGVIDKVDANGTHISDYLKEFSIYRL